MTNHDLVTPTNVIEHHIHVSNPAPVAKKGAPKSAAENQALSDWVQEMVECGIAGPSDSLNCAPIVIVMKRQEPGDTGPQEIRVCINYRARNETTYGDATACLEVMSTLQALAGSQYYCSADRKSAVHQIAMAHESKGFTAFQRCGKGSFEYRKMPFGLKTAPATFIKAMGIILAGALAAQPSLAYPNHTKRYTVACDWQPGHMAANLSQPHSVEVHEEALVVVHEVERPVQFIARKLSGYEAGWQATTGEQACAVWAVREVHCYLYGVEFTLITDHKALVAMLHCQDITGKLARWNVDLDPYDFRVQFRPGSQLCTDKEIRAEAPDPALISTAAPVFTEVSDNPENYVELDERKRWVDRYVKAPPPASVDAETWEDFKLDFRPYENLQGPTIDLPSARWQQELAPELLRIMVKADPSYKTAMLEEDVLPDWYSLMELEIYSEPYTRVPAYPPEVMQEIPESLEPYTRVPAYPPEVMQETPESLEQTRCIQGDHAGMEALHEKEKANITRAQDKQVKGYAQLKKPRNRRVEAF